MKIDQIKYPFYHSTLPNVIFVHITKTGGTSLRAALKFNRPNKDLGLKKHQTSRQIIELIGQEKWDQSFKFCFVRNPWDRMVSLYNYMKKMKRSYFVKNPNASFDFWLSGHLHKSKHKGLGKLTQTEWISDQQGNIIVDYIGCFERLQEDFNIISSKLGFANELKHKNKGEYSKHYREWYSQKNMELVAEYFKDDIINFGYKF